MAWQTPVEDWEAPDCPLYSDFNRIESNIAYLKGVYDTLNDTVTTHTADTTIHFTTATCRAADSVPFVLECRQSDPASPVTGQIWLRTDL